MTDKERENVVTNIKRLGKLAGWGPEATKVAEIIAGPVLASKVPELTRDPSALTDDALKGLGFKVGDIFQEIANSFPPSHNP
jgi:hypothetical protein